MLAFKKKKGGGERHLRAWLQGDALTLSDRTMPWRLVPQFLRATASI